MHLFRSFYARTLMTSTPRSVGLIIIGDEILNGKIKETNSHLVCSTAASLGFKLEKISIIPDSVDVIAHEARKFMQKFHTVITSGGIGSTHDDRTFEALALATGQEMHIHPELIHVVENFFSFDSTLTPNDPRTRLARIPLKSELVYGIDNATGRQSNYPVVKVGNLYALPGVPHLFQTALEIIKERLRDPEVQLNSRSLYVTREETHIADFLTSMAEKYGSTVNIGSYPAFNNCYYRVRVTLDSWHAAALEPAYREAKDYFGTSVVSYEPDPISCAAEAVYALAARSDPLGARVAKAINLIESTLEKFDSQQLVISFNGGKDCTVILHLVYAVLARRWHSAKSSTPTHATSSSSSNGTMSDFPKLIYIRSRSVFPELESFVQQTSKFYRLSTWSIIRPTSPQKTATMTNGTQTSTHGSLIIYEGPIKRCLERLIQDFPTVRGVFMGTRSSDPRAGDLESTQMTDPGWPQLLRIHPILEWTYADVWQFARGLSLPYCSLYDVGYTSLGSIEDTHPNPSLRHITSSGCIAYHPAYTLEDPASERSGRRMRSPKDQIVPEVPAPK